MAKKSVVPNTFLYKGMPFVRVRFLEYKTHIYLNHKYMIKWSLYENNDFEFLYSVIQNADEKDLKYFVDTKRVRVRGVHGYGYLQPIVDTEIPSNFDRNRANGVIERLGKNIPFVMSGLVIMLVL